MRYHGHFEGEKPGKTPKGKKPMKKGTKIVLIILLVLILATAGAAIWGVSYYNRLFGQMNIVTLDENLYDYLEEETTAPVETTFVSETTEAETTEATTVETTRPPMTAEDIINILVVGQASRYGEEGHMADTTILVTVNTYDGTVKLSSVLRDTLVRLPAYKSHKEGRTKFNMAYHLGYTWEGTAGAMAYTNLTMKRNFGVEVDYNIEMDFESFTKVVDYMGGVEIELTEAEAKYLNDDDLYVLYDVEPGLQYLDGMAALSYARMRKAEGDGDSDIKRSDRQRKLIEALLNKVRGLSLADLQSVADTLLPLITTTMTPADVADVLLRVLPLVKDLKIEKGSIPIETTYWGEMYDIYGDGFEHSVLMFDEGQNKRLIRAFTEAEVS